MNLLGVKFSFVALLLLITVGLQAQTKNSDAESNQPQTFVQSVEDVEIVVSSLFPNPASDYIIIEGSAGDICDWGKCITVKIHDLSGNLYYVTETGFERGALEINIQDWPPQYYIINIYAEEYDFFYENRLLVRR